MNFQPLVDNLHLVLPGIALIMFAWTQFATYKAKKNPEIDWWDSAADRSKWVLEQYQWGLDQLIRLGHGKWTGAEKLAESTARAKRFEDLWAQGKIVEALAEVTGFRASVQDKLEKAAAAQLPFDPSRPPSITTPLLGGVTQGPVPASSNASGIGSGDGSPSGRDGEQIGQALGSALDKVRASTRK